jgi:hypothetical protein
MPNLDMAWRVSTLLKCLLLLALAVLNFPARAQGGAMQDLLAKYVALEPRLRQNQFNRPVVLDSLETPNRVTGEVHAVVDYPFSEVSARLNNPNHWCDVMSLHINTKYCRAVTTPVGTLLKVNIGKKTAENLKSSARVEFTYTTSTVMPTYLEIRLSAKNGPLGTSDYNINFEAVALPDTKTFLKLRYSYSMNFAARLAIQTYLATVASNKVGFTTMGKGTDGQTTYTGGVRGLAERNTMRYYLAIDSFLAAGSELPQAQLEKRLQSWFSAVERYPRQLHELDRGEYMAMKRDEYLRQQTAD